nr:hypothetical protein [Tanacetum cinerariifolium]
MMDWLSIVETDKVIHTVETDIVKLVVEIESFSMRCDKFDEETGSSNGLQPKQADLSYVYALNEIHLHGIHVVPSKHEDVQCGRLSAPKRIALSARVVIEKFHAFREKQHQPEDIHELLCKLLEDLQIIKNSSNAITPDLPSEEPDNSLSMRDEHLSTILETESDELIKSSVKNLFPILSESEDIFDDTCDVPFCDNSPRLDVLNDHFELFSDFNDDCTSSDDDSFEDNDYVEASPPDSELVSLEEVKDNILREKLLNINIFIAKIKSLNDNLTSDFVLKSPSSFPIPVEDSDSFFEKSDTSLSYSDNSLPEFKTFSNHMKETTSGSTTTHAGNFMPEYESFLFEIEPDQGELTSIVMEDIFGEPHVHVPNVLPTLMLDSDFIPFDDSF